MWDWSAPQWCSRPQHSFSLATFSFPLSPPLVSLDLSFLPFSPSNWTVFSENTASVPLLFLPAWVIPPVALVFVLEQRKPLEAGEGTDASVVLSSAMQRKGIWRFVAALHLQWLQHPGGRSEAENQHSLCALACLNAGQEAWIALSWGPCSSC